MFDNQTRISELTVDELVTLIRATVRHELRTQPEPKPRRQEALLELKPFHVGAWPSSLQLLSREDYYDDER